MQFIANSIQKEIKYFLKNNILFYYIHNESEKNFANTIKLYINL